MDSILSSRAIKRDMTTTTATTNNNTTNNGNEGGGLEFLTRFISSSMECAETRTREAERRLKATMDKSKAMIDNWHQPTKTVGFWKREGMQGTHKTSLEPQLRGGIGRRTNWG